jgi:outer membrane lipoprotein carrier protein
MKRILPIFLVTLLALLATPVLAADTARSRLDAFAHDLHSLSGHFSQTLTNNNGARGDSSQGTLALQEPRQFRWQAISPYKQLIVADGSRVWMYDPDLEQVTVRTQSTEEAQSPLTILTDMSQLDRDFKAAELGERDGLLWLQLTPTDDDKQFVSAELGFDADSLRRMIFTDRLGNRTDIRFSDWQRNPVLPVDTFDFTPPAGADVIGDLPVSEVHPLQQ